MNGRALWVIAALLAAILVVQINPPGPWLECKSTPVEGVTGPLAGHVVTSSCHQTWVPTNKWVGVRF